MVVVANQTRMGLWTDQTSHAGGGMGGLHTDPPVNRYVSVQDILINQCWYIRVVVVDQTKPMSSRSRWGNWTVGEQRFS